MTKIILIVGLPGSGKSTTADYIKKKFNADIVHSGDIIREEIKRRGWEYNPRTDAIIAHWFHTGGRERLVVKRVWNKIRKSRKKLIIIEGLRSEKQLKYLEEFSKIKPVIISIIASFKVRVKRELKRGRFGKKETISYIRFREKLEKSHGEWKIIKKADYTIDNSRLSVKQTEKKIEEIVRELS